MHRRFLPLGLAASLIVAACGASGGSPSPAPGGTQPPGAPTQKPADGGNPAGWDRHGKVTFEVAGAATAKGEAGFAPGSSVFGGPGEALLTFGSDGSDVMVLLTISGDTLVAQYMDGAVTVTATDCTTSGLSGTSSRWSGTFDCTEAMAIKESGAVFMDVAMRGTFEARP